MIFASGVLTVPVRLLTRAAQGVRHRRACVPLDLGRMAELAAARSSRLAYDLLRRDFRIETRSRTVIGLSLSRGNNSHENAQRTEQPTDKYVSGPWFSLDLLSKVRWNCTPVVAEIRKTGV